jgi:hypothetical protein
MKTGGSNYITINGSMDSPVIGAYHLYPEVVASNLASMFEHGQRKITLLLWFGPVDFAENHLWHHVCDSTGGTLCEQHQANLLALLQSIAAAGYNEVHLRFGAQGRALVRTWTSWRQAQFDENKAFILNTIALMEANKGSMPVIYDLGVEHAWEVWNTNPTHRTYCVQLWKAYLDAGHDPALSCAFSIIHGGAGLQPMLLRFQQRRLAFPGCYCVDAYDYEYQELTGIVPVLSQFGQESKPVYLQETNYNDPISCADVRRAIADAPTLNFQCIFQWPEVRDTPPGGGIPDIYPRRFDNYLVEL